MKKDKKQYFIVGFVVLLTMVILVFGVFFLNDNDPRERFHRYFILVPQVSTLSIDDPVKVNGVKLGKVETMDLVGHQVCVRVRLREDVRISRNSEARIQNIGLLGERQVGILLGDTNSYWNPGDTLNGIFDAGIAEAMGLAGEVFDSTRVLVQVVRGVVDSTFAVPQFRERFHSLLARTEELEIRVGVMLAETDPRLKETLGRLNEVGRKVNEVLDENRAPIQGLMSEAHGLTQDTKATLQQVDSLMNRVHTVLGRLDRQDNTLGILMNDRKLHDDLNRTVQSADSLVQTILKHGLDVNIDFF